MQLYDGGRVPNARRVRIYLAEKGLAVPLAPVDLGKSEHKSAEMTRLNPLHRVPVLVLDDGTVLTESIAICRYFEELHPEPPLFGVGALERAQVEMWQRRLELELFLPITHVFRHLHPAMAGYEQPQVRDWGQANIERAQRFMRLFDDHLRGRDFVVGGRLSVADITGLVALDFTRAARIPIPADLADLGRWHAAMAARPSARA